MGCQNAKTNSAGAVCALDDATRRALDGVPQIVWVNDAEGAVVFLNQAANEFWGRPATPLWGRDFEALVHPDDRALVCDAWIAALSRGVPFHHRLRLLDADGAAHWFTVKAKPWPSEAGSPAQHWMGVAQIEPAETTDQPAYNAADAAPLRAAERRVQSEIQQSQKMEAMGRLAGGIAHDFNNLLTVVNGYSDMLVESLPVDHPGREPAMIIRDAVELAAEITKQLLSFSRQSVIAPRVLKLNDALAAEEGVLRRMLGDDVALTLALGDKVGAVKIDPRHLSQVVTNLAVNAREAMPHGGRLTIATRPQKFSPDDPLIAAGLVGGPYTVVAVSDTGPGVPPELRSRIFEPFFTTKARGRGVGLGLATVYNIVKQWGGHIEVVGEPGSGATFNVYLPTVNEGANASDAA